MDEYTEGLLVVAAYVASLTAFSLPFLVGYLFIKAKRALSRIINVVKYVEENERESRKYHE